jgi:formylglycine-generating enzyme required for sulfatase activity
MVAVGSYPSGAARWGHLDMAGLLWEWLFDNYLGNYYETVPNCTNCVYYENSLISNRVLRGGWFAGEAELGAMRAARRFSASPESASKAYGFRCAR